MIDKAEFAEILDPMVRALPRYTGKFVAADWADWHGFFGHDATADQLRTVVARCLRDMEQFPTPKRFREILRMVQNPTPNHPHPDSAGRVVRARDTSPYAQALKAVRVAIMRRVLRLASGGTQLATSLQNTMDFPVDTNFDVAGLLDEFPDSEWPTGQDVAELGEFRRRVEARFETRWGIWTQPAEVQS